MLEPDLFDKYGAKIQYEAEIILNDFIHLIKWNEHGEDVVMDAGCGPGKQTTSLIPFLPKTFKKLIGVDYSQQMIDHASSKYTQPRVSFQLLDITTKTLPEDFVGGFDHIFSFLCLHMVPDQKQALENFSKMLRPGGNVFLMFFKTFGLYDIHENLSKTEKWGAQVRNLTPLVSPYHRSDNAYVEVETLLKQTGFTNINIHLKKSSYKLEDLPTFKAIISSANKYYTLIPNDCDCEYTEEVVKMSIDWGFIQRDEEKRVTKLELPYEMFIIVASKET